MFYAFAAIATPFLLVLSILFVYSLSQVSVLECSNILELFFSMTQPSPWGAYKELRLEQQKRSMALPISNMQFVD